MRYGGRISSIAFITGALLLAAACNDGSERPASSASEIVEVSVTCGQALAMLPREYAMRSGIDRDHGLELVCAHAETGPEIAAALISGEVVVAEMVPAILYTVLEQGVDMVAFLPVLDREMGDLIVRADFPLPNADDGWEGVMRDLQGARIGVVVRGGAAEDLARGLFIAADLDPDGPTYIATGLSTTLAALDAAEVDAAIAIEPGITVAVEENIAIQPFSLRDLTGPPFMDWAGLMYVATRDYAEQNTEILERFSRMWREALDWLKAPGDRTDAIELTGDFLDLEPSVAEVMFDRNRPYWADSLRVEPARFDAVGDFYHDIGRFQKAYHVADYGFDVDE